MLRYNPCVTKCPYKWCEKSHNISPGTRTLMAAACSMVRISNLIDEQRRKNKANPLDTRKIELP